MSDIEIGRMAAEIEKAAEQSRRYRLIDHFTPYTKQQDFIAAGLRYRERALFAGSQLGKSEIASYELATHLTGLYGSNWSGVRYDRPIRAWAVGENLKMTRDISQKKLVGEPGNAELQGTGFIPKHLIISDGITMARGEGDAIDTVQVRHASGGISTLRFRTYNAGRQALQGETLDFCWLDEEPDHLEIYSECLARITANPNGRLIITFTPLKGLTGVSLRYREEHSPDRTYVQMGISDIPDGGHIRPQDRDRIIAGYPEHEREARSKGEPMLGSGRVYPLAESAVVEDTDPLSFPGYWKWIAGLDFGVQHSDMYSRVMTRTPTHFTWLLNCACRMQPSAPTSRRSKI